jgi:hypothetical protein
MAKTAVVPTTLVILLAAVGAASCNVAPKDSPASAAPAPAAPGSVQASAKPTSAAASSSSAKTEPRLEGPGRVALGGTGVAVTLPADVSLDDGGTGSSWFINGRRTSGLIKTSRNMPKTAEDLAKKHLCGPKQKNLTTKNLEGGGFMVRCEGPGVQTPDATLTYKVTAALPIVTPAKTEAGRADVAIECFNESTELSDIDNTAEICGSLHKQP